MDKLVGQLGYAYNGDKLCSHIGRYQLLETFLQ